MVVWMPAVAAAVLLVVYNFLISLPGILPEIYQQYILFALITCLGILLARYTSLLVLSALSRPGGDRPSELLGFAIGFIVFMGCMLASMHYVLGADVASILATSAIATVALGFALQATLGNLFEGLSIQVHRPFRLRDTVEFTDGSGITHAGTVETLSWRAMRLRKSDNSTVTVPNNVLAQTAMRVISVDDPLQVTCSFSAPASASPGRVMSAARRAVASVDGVLQDWPCDVLLTAYDSGADLSYRASFYIDPAASDPERIQSLAFERVWYAFAREGISPGQHPGSPADPRQSIGILVTGPTLRFNSLPAFRRLSADLQQQLTKRATLGVFGSGEKLSILPGSDPGLMIVVYGLIDVPFAGAEQVFSPREQAASYWSEEKLQQVARHFQPFVGPAATFLVKEAARTTSDVHGLYRRLGATIVDPDERAQFLRYGPNRPALEKGAGSWFGMAAGLIGNRPVTELPMCRVETMVFGLASGDLLDLYEAYPEDRPILIDAVLDELAELGQPSGRSQIEAVIGARLDHQARSVSLAS